MLEALKEKVLQANLLLHKYLAELSLSEVVQSAEA